MMWFYLVTAMVLAFAAAYVWFIWVQVSGIRGAMTGVLLTSFCFMALLLSAMHSPDPHVSQRVLVALFRAMWPPALVAAVIVADCYAADHNDHLTFTTRSYHWYKRITSRALERQRRKRGIRHECSA